MVLTWHRYTTNKNKRRSTQKGDIIESCIKGDFSILSTQKFESNSHGQITCYIALFIENVMLFS